jgi:hypothetical protein
VVSAGLNGFGANCRSIALAKVDCTFGDDFGAKARMRVNW